MPITYARSSAANSTHSREDFYERRRNHAHRRPGAGRPASHSWRRHRLLRAGESYLATLDALYGARNAIRMITCRQEGGVTNMAEAYGKITGKPGIAFVTRGPGACNGSIGVHTAMQDSTPMVIFIGQVARDQEYREAFQEVDYHQFYGAICKWVVQIETADRIPELVSQAFHRAVAAAEHLDEQEAQALVGPANPPSLVDRRMDLEQLPGPPPAPGRGGRPDHEAGLQQPGEVLPDGVVVEPEMIGELSDVDSLVGIGDVAEDAIPGGIAQRPRLASHRVLAHGRRKVTLQVSSSI